MLLTPEDAALFFKLMPALQVFAKQKLQMIKRLDTVKQYQNTSNTHRVKLRDAVCQQRELIDEFVRVNPSGFSADELAVVSGWKNFVAGDFMIERVLKKYAILLIGNNKVYGVLALTEPFPQVLGAMQQRLKRDHAVSPEGARSDWIALLCQTIAPKRAPGPPPQRGGGSRRKDTPRPTPSSRASAR